MVHLRKCKVRMFARSLKKEGNILTHASSASIDLYLGLSYNAPAWCMILLRGW